MGLSGFLRHFQLNSLPKFSSVLLVLDGWMTVRIYQFGNFGAFSTRTCSCLVPENCRLDAMVVATCSNFHTLLNVHAHSSPHVITCNKLHIFSAPPGSDPLCTSIQFLVLLLSGCIMARYKTGNSLQSIIIHRRANKEEEIISTTTKDVIFANEHPVFNTGNGNWTKSLIITLRDRLFGAIKTLLPICSIWWRRRLRPDTLAEHYCQNFRNRKKWMDARTPAKNFFVTVKEQPRNKMTQTEGEL